MDANFQNCTMLHVDADGFFAAVEQALDPALRGKPVVTGAERGIIAAASYEAKRLGIKRGLQLHEARARCPELVVRPSDYEAYSLYSQRLFAILRRFTPNVEEYSVDEAFADLGGCELALGTSLDAIAANIRQTVATELGLTVSVGISLTKTLAKLCSKFRKPNGQTIVRAPHLPILLRRTAIDKVWGIGGAGTEKLRRCGVATAQNFTALEGTIVRRLLHKPGLDTWDELQGRRRIPFTGDNRVTYDSMMRGHTFAPPSAERTFVFAEALRNLTFVMARLRRRRHRVRELGLALRHKDYTTNAAALPLPLSSIQDNEVTPLLRALFEALYIPGQIYRSTTVWLDYLIAEDQRQLDLFEETPQRCRRDRLCRAVDSLNERFGQYTVGPGTLLDLRTKKPHTRDAAPQRYSDLAHGETQRHLALPRLTLPNQI